MKSFVIADPRKCIGCGACEIVCASVNIDLPIPETARPQTPFNPRINLINTAEITVPIQCRQCEDAPCAKACPTDGLVYLDGAVHIQREKCIGCKMCTLACPFGAVNVIRNNDHSDLPDFYANKCEVCSDRAEGPACVEICPAKAFTLISAKKLKETINSRRNKAVSVHKQN